jgi:hypothetical protein
VSLVNGAFSVLFLGGRAAYKNYEDCSETDALVADPSPRACSSSKFGSSMWRVVQARRHAVH